MALYDIDLEKALDVAMKAARRAGDIMLGSYKQRRKDVATNAVRLSKEGDGSVTAGLSTTDPTESLCVAIKSFSTDLVTQYDKMCDEVITKMLSEFNFEVVQKKRAEGFESFEFRFITEEITPDDPLTDAPTWIVDPIDGTMAFVHGGCDCCVSIGLAIKKQTVVAVVYCPFLPTVRGSPASHPSLGDEAGEMYTAIRGKGAFLNGQQIHVCASAVPASALVVFNFPAGARLSSAELLSADPAEIDAMKRMKHKSAVEASGHILERLALQNVQGIRAYCACALILSQIAAGRVDLFMEPGGMIWDVCAGSLLVAEAGGVVKNIWGGEFGMEGGTTIIAAANNELAEYGAGICAEVNYGDYWRK